MRRENGHFGSNACLCFLALWLGICGCSGVSAPPATSDGSAPPAAQRSGDLLNVSIEEGGQCKLGNRPCWRRVKVITADSAIELTTPENSQRSSLTPLELHEVVAITERPEFLQTISASEPVCPAAFDFQIIFVAEFSDALYRDPHGQGCGVSDEFRDHPYYQLRTLMNRLAEEHFSM